MEFEEIKKLRPVFNKYLDYKGINLWEVGEYLITYSLIEDYKNFSFEKDLKEIIMRFLFKISNFYRSKIKKKCSYSKKEILMIAYNPVHVTTFLPILKQSENIKIIGCDAPFSRITKESFKKNHIDYIDIYSYFDKNLFCQLNKAEKWLDITWKKIKGDNSLKKDLGKNYKQIINTLKYFMKTRKKFLDIICYIELLNKLYETEKNKLVILGEELNPLAKAAVIIAKKKKIKTIIIQHGTVLGDHFFLDVISDKITVSGKREENFILSQGVNQKKIEMIGQPRFDDIPEKNKLSKEAACKKLSLDPKKKRIVFATQYLVQGDQTIKHAIEEFLETIKKIKNKDNFEFIIKLRSGGVGYLPKIDKNLSIKKMEDVDLHLLLRCSDVLITASSMVAMEAVLLNCPVITIEIGGRLNSTNYEKDGVGIGVYEKNKLIWAITKVFEDRGFKKKFIRSRKKFIEDFAYKIDGKSTERINNLIKSVLKN